MEYHIELGLNSKIVRQAGIALELIIVVPPRAPLHLSYNFNTIILLSHHHFILPYPIPRHTQ